MTESESMSKLNEEKANVARIDRLLQRAATPAVRHEFDQEFHPSVLKTTLNKTRLRLEKLRKQRVINQYQWTLLYPINGAPSSSEFDLTLMICLLRNLTEQYESDVLPLETDKSKAAYLMRLRDYRNAIVHNKELTLSKKDFTKYWENITDAICKFGGENYRKTCQQLRYTSLDGSEKDVHLEIKKIAKGIREHNKEEYLYWIEDTERYFPISATVKNITQAFDQCKHHFVVISGKPGTGKTALARYVALNLHKNNDVSIVPANNPDIIKNRLAVRSQNNFINHPVKNKNMSFPNERHGKKNQQLTIEPDLEKIQNNQANKVRVLALDDSQSSQTTGIKTIFVIDDFLGRYTINKPMTNAWKQLFYEYYNCPSNDTDSIYIVVTCREEIRNSDQFKSLKKLYQFSEYNMDNVSSNVRETKDQKLDIASCYMNPETTQSLFAEINIQKVDRFHTLCLLYSQLHQSTENMNFFTDPNSVFEQEFEEIRTLSEPCYIGLALLTIFDGKLIKPLHDQHIYKLVRELCVECELLQNDIKLSKIQKDINMVVGRYIIDEGTSYYVVHPELYDILLNYFMKKIPKSLINFGSNDFLQTRVALQGSIHYNSFTGVHPIGKQHEELFFNRLIKDIKKKEFENALRNIQVANTAYQEELIRHVQRSDGVLQILASSCLPMILSIENDFSQFLDLILNERKIWNLSQGVEFDRHYDVIDYDDRKLLNLQSSIYDKEIILMLACLYGSVRVVKLLLCFEYDINYQNSMQKAPIHLACLRGNDEVVKLLLGLQSTGIKDNDDNQALDGLECDIDIQDCYGQTALHLACRMGHTKVVYLLLKKWKFLSSEADKQGSLTLLREKLSVTDNQGRLALHIAAENGSEDIIGILFRAVSLSDCPGPDIHAEVIHENNFLCNLINAQDQNGKTFIFTACENGRTYCVQYLLNFRCCDIDIYNDRNETPIFRACQNDNTELVDILVKYNADVNLKDITGRTPLHVAVESKNENMMKSILNNKNCIVNLKDKNSYSALHLAIFGKNWRIVKTLLEAECYDKCDINKPDSKRNTPLMLAICADATHIVEFLIKSGCNLYKYNVQQRGKTSLPYRM